MVTGASSGLGAAVAAALAQHGAKVIAVARTADRLLHVVDSLRETGGQAEAMPADVTSQIDVDRLRETVADRYGKLDLLCNCVGISTRGEVLSASAEEFQQLWEVNFLSVVRITRAFADMLTEANGHLVNIGSLASKVAPRYLGAYPASKFALAAYSQQLRLELGPKGLHVLLVCPGPILRGDGSPRYAEQSADLPAEAQLPAAGAKLRGIDPDSLAEWILAACQARKPELVVPRRARLLMALGQLFPELGDKLLLKFTSGK